MAVCCADMIALARCEPLPQLTFDGKMWNISA